MTIKDSMIVKNLDSTFGLGSRCFKPFNHDGIWAAMIKKAGGIIFAKSNLP